MARRPKILVSNDDGIQAPGIRALITQLVSFSDVLVSAPSGERSAQSHAITLRRYLCCSPVDIPDAIESFAVDGTPADSVMLALNSQLFKQGAQFDLVVSGINRGDNCGLHVIYSGTVGAAREATCKGIPAIAFSLDNHQAREEKDYESSAKLSAVLVKAVLGLLPGQDGPVPAEAFKNGTLLNVNFPSALDALKGFYLTKQSINCVFPAFKEIHETSGPHLAEIEEHTPNMRMFRNYAGLVQKDDAENGDRWAVSANWVSVTPLCLCSSIPEPDDHAKYTSFKDATAAILAASAKEVGLSAGGCAKL